MGKFWKMGKEIIFLKFHYLDKGLDLEWLQDIKGGGFHLKLYQNPKNLVKS